MTTRFVDIRQARVSLEVQEGQTILDAALAAGIPYPHGCRSGRCGSCKSRLIEGEVELLQHSRFALSEEEKADGLILACRAVPQTDAAVAWLGSDDDDAVEAPRRVEVTCPGIFPPFATRVRPNERTDEDEEGTTDRGTDYRYPSGA